MTNEYGDLLDRNGYAPTIIQDDTSRCFLCGKRNQKLDRHEVFPGGLRTKCKNLGIWVCICKECHQGSEGVHRNRDKANYLKEVAQNRAMDYYGWAIDDWHRQFGKNFVNSD